MSDSKNKKLSGHIKITSAGGLPGARLISADDGIEIEVIRQGQGATTFEIRQYYEGGNSESLIIKLTRAKVAIIVDILNCKLKAVKSEEISAGDSGSAPDRNKCMCRSCQAIAFRERGEL